MNRRINTIWNKKLPSILGFFFLILAVSTITWLSRNTILTGTKAAAGNVPKDVRISNISDTTFTVSYVTDASVLGSISYGSLGTMDQVALDDRDSPQAAAKEHTTHYITVENLAPSTTYSFTITSGDEKFINKEAAYQVTTGSTLAASDSSRITISGKVNHENGTQPADAIVYLSANNSQLLSALTDEDGKYLGTIQQLRATNLSSLIPLTPETPLILQIVSATAQSKASILAGQSNPVPLIILSKNYDFAVSNEPLSESPTATDSAELSGTPVAFPTQEEGTGTTPKILTPEEEQGFTDQQPLFKGKAEPNETVTITINSEQTITATVKADANGNWQYRPDEPLEPGPHTITMKTVDSSGLMRIITQSFVVYAEGSQFTEPSVSPVASGTNTPTPTTIPSITATAAPSVTNTPTPTTVTTTPSVSVTTTQTPPPTNGPTTSTSVSPTLSPTTPPIPVTGNTSLFIAMMGIFATIGIGALLFIFTAV